MIAVDQAVARICAAFAPLPPQTVALADAAGRTLAADHHAGLAQPPQPVSAMDGYAVRSADRGTRRVIGSAPAGHPYPGSLGAGEAVRIFTGGVVPAGADAIALQENAVCYDDAVRFHEEPQPGHFIRAAGLDFAAGEVLGKSGDVVTPRLLALLAAGDIAQLVVRRRPVIGFAATGDELSRPGAARKPGGIVASSGYALAALIAGWGGEPRDLGILPDSVDAIAALAETAKSCDLLLTLGGASVGDHDLVQQALGPQGFALDFWKVAMRPGKPLIFGRLGHVPLLGLPGNPVSALVCALLFARPAIAVMLGQPAKTPLRAAKLDGNLGANDGRQDYLRATTQWRDGALWARPQPVQDSSMLKLLARSDALILRAPHAPALTEGAAIEIIPL